METVKGAVGQPTPGADAPQDEPEQPQADQGRDKDDDGHRDPGIQVGPGVNGGQEEERPDAEGCCDQQAGQGEGVGVGSGVSHRRGPS